jgi:hypothetical protein
MRRLLVVLILSLVSVGWPAVTVSAAGHAATASAAAGSLQADFDNDGFVDLAVGVPHEAIGTATAAGAVDVLYGSAGGLTGVGSQAFWQGTGGAAGTAETFDEFGSALAAGDFNNDSFADLAVGVPSEGVGAAAAAGAVNVLYGSAGGLTGTGSQAFWQGSGGAAGALEGDDRFGSALAAGDFNNDGVDDLAVGAPGEDVGTAADAGAVSVLYGSAGGLTGTGSQQFRQGAGGVAGAAEPDDRFGWALAAGGFNTDSAADLAIGVPLEDIGTVDSAGAVNVLYGSASGLTGVGSQQFRQGAGGVPGTPESDFFGWALAAGDFNDNGFADLAVGVPLQSIGAAGFAGEVDVLFGSAGGLSGTGSQQWSQASPGVVGTAETDDEFGRALTAGDFNSNGSADLAIGVPFEDIGAIRDAGVVNLVYGSAGGLSAAGNQQFQQGAGGVAGTAEADDWFAFALTAGDFNSNGSADLAIGVPFEDVGTIAEAGAVNVLYGSAGGLGAAGNQQFWQGPGGAAGTLEAGDWFGLALAGPDPLTAAAAASSRPQLGTTRPVPPER